MNDWFRCPRCAEPARDGKLKVSLVLGFKNASLSLSCRWCGFRHKARDWRNQNLKKWIRRRRWFKQSFLTHPLLGATMHSAVKCAACSARGHVEVELELVEDGHAAVLRCHCHDCDERYENRLEHE